jgi:hypothetical protein
MLEELGADMPTRGKKGRASTGSSTTTLMSARLVAAARTRLIAKKLLVISVSILSQ